jgi:hypothetical protein
LQSFLQLIAQLNGENIGRSGYVGLDPMAQETVEPLAAAPLL